jgi:hypothetical protein
MYFTPGLRPGLHSAAIFDGSLSYFGQGFRTLESKQFLRNLLDKIHCQKKSG